MSKEGGPAADSPFHLPYLILLLLQFHTLSLVSLVTLAEIKVKIARTRRHRWHHYHGAYTYCQPQNISRVTDIPFFGLYMNLESSI